MDGKKVTPPKKKIKIKTNMMNAYTAVKILYTGRTKAKDAFLRFPKMKKEGPDVKVVITLTGAHFDWRRA